MRKARTIYFNDARHYYLFVFEPPMTMEDAWRPVDEAAGTAVDTFIYGVARDDGLFYPSKVGLRFGTDMQPFNQAAYYRVWNNMQSLMDRGLDPLTVLIDRAHEKGMDFFASLRLGAYGGMNPNHNVRNGGRGFVHEEVRNHLFAVVRELATEYATEGVELDFAAPPGGTSFHLQLDDVPEYTPVMTDWVRKVSDTVRNRSGKPGLVGVRVYPTEEMNRKYGQDVITWLREGLVDFVVPLLYLDFKLDPDMPIDWLIQAAHESDIPVYGMVQPYVEDESTGTPDRVYATPAMTRAAAANFWDKGVDGLYAWFMRWPLGDTQRRTLTELGDPELVKEADKHYVLRKRTDSAADMGYDAAIPVEIPAPDPEKKYPIRFYIADDIDAASDRIREIKLRLNVANLLSEDNLTISLNGRSLAAETCLRDYGRPFDPYAAQWLEFQLRNVRPRKGENVLEISLDRRPAGMGVGITVQDVQINVAYGSYPST